MGKMTSGNDAITLDNRGESMTTDALASTDTDAVAVTSDQAPAKLKKPLTHVVIVLDRSGSMASIWDPMKAALSDQVDNLRGKKAEQRIRVWFALFDDQYSLPYQAVKLGAIDVESLMRDNGPRGTTALFDALSDTVLKVEETVDDPDCAFLVIVVTDGFENASKRVSGPELKEALTRLQKTDRWTFVYLGANQDITQVVQQTGIVAGNTMPYAATPDSVMANMGSASPTTAGMNSYFAGRTAGETSTTVFYGPDEDEDDDKDSWAKAAKAAKLHRP